MSTIQRAFGVGSIVDLERIRERTLRERQKHLAPAEAIVERELKRLLADWNRRRNGPIIARLTQEFEARRQAIVAQLLAKLNGRLTAEDRAYIEGAFKLLQNQFLHGPISALAEETPEGRSIVRLVSERFGLTPDAAAGKRGTFVPFTALLPRFCTYSTQNDRPSRTTDRAISR